MADLNAGQVIAKQLKADGIDTVFTVYAGPMTQALEALPREGIRVIGCRHEEQAGFMAQALGYITKKPGVVIVGSGPAMTNTITSLHVATENGWPLVVLGGSAGLSSRQAGPTRAWGGFQESPQPVMAVPACKWVQEVDATERIPEFIHLGLGKAISGRPGGVYIDFPGHILGNTVPEDRLALRTSQPLQYRPFPDPAGVERIAAMLAEAERPLILIGKGAAWADAAEGLTRLVGLGIPFLPSPMGRGTVPDDHPMCMGATRSAALGGADVIVMMGGRFNWIFGFGRPPAYAPDVRLAHVDVVAEEHYNAAHVKVGLVADCAVAAQQIYEALRGRKLNPATEQWRESLRTRADRNAGALHDLCTSDATPISPYRLLYEVRNLLDRDATVTVDGEITLGIGRIVIPAYFPRHRLNSGTTACMGTGVPYAIGASLARPGKQVVGVLGDYAFGAGAMDVETGARVGATPVFVVVNNQGITGRNAQDRQFRPEDGLIAGLLPARYEKMAEMVNGHAEYVEAPHEIRPALERALASGKVAVVNVAVDPKGGTRRGGGYL